MVQSHLRITQKQKRGLSMQIKQTKKLSIFCLPNENSGEKDPLLSPKKNETDQEYSLFFTVTEGFLSTVEEITRGVQIAQSTCSGLGKQIPILPLAFGVSITAMVIANTLVHGGEIMNGDIKQIIIFMIAAGAVGVIDYAIIERPPDAPLYIMVALGIFACFSALKILRECRQPRVEEIQIQDQDSLVKYDKVSPKSIRNMKAIVEGLSILKMGTSMTYFGISNAMLDDAEHGVQNPTKGLVRTYAAYSSAALGGFELLMSIIVKYLENSHKLPKTETNPDSSNDE
jgi:hypothetical protein